MKTFFAMVVLALIVTGCDQSAALPSLNAEVGTKAWFRQGPEKMLMEIIGVDDQLVRTEISSGSQILSMREYYRGLIPVSGTDGNRQFRFDFDSREMDALFPLTKGKSVSVSGTLTIDGLKTPLDVVIQATVKGRKTMSVRPNNYDVMVVEVQQIYRGAQGVRTRKDIYYHAPDLSMNLKSVTKDEDFQSYWYVTDIIQRGLSTPINPRRAGSVMI